MINSLVQDFFLKNFENQINEEMFNRNYNFPYEKVLCYVNELCKLDFDLFLDYLLTLKDITPVEPRHVFQFSNFDDCTSRLCEILLENNDVGFRFNEIGALLLNDGKERKDGAYRKYGENATKTAYELGLVQLIENFSFLSCLGFIYNKLDEDTKRKLTALLILRSVFFQNLIIKAYNEKFQLKWLLMSLSESTQKRRIPNLNYLINYLKNNTTGSLNSVFDNVII